MAVIREWTRQGSAKAPYVIQLRSDGRLSCDCLGWTRRVPRSCKHTKDIGPSLGRIDARQDGEYVLDLDPAAAADAPEPVRPAPLPAGEGPAYRPLMLASKAEAFSWSDYPASEWVMEQKFDGERCFVAVRAGAVRAWQRAQPGRETGAVRDLAPGIAATLAKLPDADLDGEIVVKGVGMISSDVKATVNRSLHVFVVFDALMLRGQDLTQRSYAERRAALAAAVEGLLPSGGPVMVSTAVPPSRTTYAAVVAAGGEGVVLKRLASSYAGHRSLDWIKVKDQKEATVTITGFAPSEVNGAKNAVIVFQMPSGVPSKCKTPTAQWGRRIAAGEIVIGTKIEIAFQTLLPSGKPRHPVAKRVVGEA